MQTTVKVYQIKDFANTPYTFRDYMANVFNMEDYKQVASFELEKLNTTEQTLEKVFELGNINQEIRNRFPEMRSISVSDIIELDGEKYYVNSFEYKNIKG